jgi:hypothetical protein
MLKIKTLEKYDCDVLIAGGGLQAAASLFTWQARDAK